MLPACCSLWGRAVGSEPWALCLDPVTSRWSISQELCLTTSSAPLRFGAENALLVQRWCTMLEACGRPVADEVLRLAAACSLQTAGTEMLQQCRGASCPWLVPVALR